MHQCEVSVSVVKNAFISHLHDYLIDTLEFHFLSLIFPYFTWLFLGFYSLSGALTLLNCGPGLVTGNHWVSNWVILIQPLLKHGCVLL